MGIMLNDGQLRGMFEGFLYEALRFLKVDEGLWPKVSIGFSTTADEKIQPLTILYPQRKVLIFTWFYQMRAYAVAGNEGPTGYRSDAYITAYIWKEYVDNGIQTPFPPAPFSAPYIFALALSILKGMPILPEMPMVLIQTAVDMLNNDYGIRCDCKTAKTIGGTLPVVTFTTDAAKEYIANYDRLVQESCQFPTPRVAPGDKGSAQNPFDNVDEAADWILGVERSLLANDPFLDYVKNEDFYFDGIFRIPWASPNVHYLPLREGRRFVATQLFDEHRKGVQRFIFKPSLTNRKFLFRGQSEFFDPCLPNLFREDKKNYAPDLIKGQELEVLLKSHPLVRLFDNGFRIFNEFIIPKIDYQGLSQHYYNRTALLDLTSEMEVAKFFAVTTYKWDEDRYVKYTGDKLGVLYYYNIYPDAFRKRKGRPYEVNAIGKQPFMRSGNQAGYLIGLEKGADFNLLPEVGYVFFKHDKAITDRIFETSQQGDLYMPNEILRTHWYNRLNGDRANVFSNAAFKINCDLNRDMSPASIKRILRGANIRIKSYTPTFSDDELDSYYASAVDNWLSFCGDIDFYSPEGAVMHDQMMNLPDNPKYAWAFRR